MKIDNFTDHIPDVFAFPDADPPIPYTELVFTAVPGYKKRRPTRKGTPPHLAGFWTISVLLACVQASDSTPASFYGFYGLKQAMRHYLLRFHECRCEGVCEGRLVFIDC